MQVLQIAFLRSSGRMTSIEFLEVAGLSVELVRKPIKNLHIGVYPPSGRVRVAAPPAISDDAVRVAILTRLGWIKKKQHEFARQAREPRRHFVSGETHYFWGKPLRLLIKPTAQRGARIRQDGSDRLLLHVPPEATTAQKAHWMERWYRGNLKDKAAPRVAKWSDQLNIPEPSWGVRQMRTKWGSCNPDKGLIWLNLDLAKKPLAALEYVILHELAHFVSRQHDEVFLSVLDRHMPSWRQIRTDLNKLPLSIGPAVL